MSVATAQAPRTVPVFSASLLKIAAYVAMYHPFRFNSEFTYSLADRTIELWIPREKEAGTPVGVLPEPLDSVHVDTGSMFQGEYIGDRETVARIQALLDERDRVSEELSNQIDAVVAEAMGISTERGEK